MSKIKLDLHDVFNDGSGIETGLQNAFAQALDRRIPLLEIIPGKGSGQLKKRVLRFLARAEIRKQYHRYDIDNANWGRIFVHFRFADKG